MWCLHPSNCSDPKSWSHLWLLSLINPSNLLRILLTLSSKSIQNLTAFHHSIIVTLIWTTILSYRPLQYPPNSLHDSILIFLQLIFNTAVGMMLLKHVTSLLKILNCFTDFIWFDHLSLLWSLILFSLFMYLCFLTGAQMPPGVLLCLGPLLPYFCCLKHSFPGCLLGWLPLLSEGA